MLEKHAWVNDTFKVRTDQWVLMQYTTESSLLRFQIPLF